MKFIKSLVWFIIDNDLCPLYPGQGAREISENGIVNLISGRHESFVSWNGPIKDVDKKKMVGSADINNDSFSIRQIGQVISKDFVNTAYSSGSDLWWFWSHKEKGEGDKYETALLHCCNWDIWISPRYIIS